MNNPNMTTIPITKDTRTKLQALMKYGETYDGLLRQFMDNLICPLCGKPSGGVHKECANKEAIKADRS